MQLSLAVVTSQIGTMRNFYAAVFGVEATGDADYVEFRTGADWLFALCAIGAIESAAPGAHAPGTNRCVRIELEVSDVDAEYERLQPVVRDWIVPPTDWPWGTRATWFRDPDGNLISLFSALSP